MATKIISKSARRPRRRRRGGGRSRLDIGCNHVRLNFVLLTRLADVNSDGATPEEKARQILALAPILKGQSGGPSSSPHSSAPQPHQEQPRPQYTGQQHKPAGSSDLIDFSYSDATPAAAPIRMDAPAQPPTTHAVIGLQEPLQPGHPIKRVDTQTKDVDEFVDAKAP